mmetsp:Transcript_24817/g.42011  ORF Transcript_24817/g.42011 Transcript_24817/m.42011 type:complete len:536 (+) Transcript_24817:197-1804(+)|eukprot:CAMPEP_0114428296 /NCGR_PEP_ID=MMETSP0103-20121206/8846_1 /TAXON_ID=37642 ORGANISM="Paraphysomonas imperforata, Strain PA2" /NCGR_SAMPLE_ID=MMETSP0103 /ASSEMBLY_ACC=CAM_ASM_000201 /LENGTH=535 /DNA_ID=CAMNT_0001597495 /DNA_START=189 /DNA_END=1796 /DNA_ORIENTATION=-
MGGSVSITAPQNDKKTQYMQNYVNNTESIKNLFKDMSQYGRKEGTKNSSANLISMADVLLYIENGVNPQLSKHYKGMSAVVKEAFYYIVGYRKNVRLEMPIKKFHRYMDTLFMFSHLYKIFAAADDHIDDDSIFVDEFARAKDRLQNVPGVEFTQEITDEEWISEFKKIDSGKTADSEGWISFREFATYCCRSIITPEAYAKEVRRRKKFAPEIGEKANSERPHLTTSTIPGLCYPESADSPSSTAASPSTPSSRKTASSIQAKNKSKIRVVVSKSQSKIFESEAILPAAKMSTQRIKLKAATYVQKPFRKRVKKKKKGDKNTSSTPELPNASMNLVTSSRTDQAGMECTRIHADGPKVVMIDDVDECSSPIDKDELKQKAKVYTGVDVIAEEKKDEEEMDKARHSFVRPLYRPRSAAQIVMDVNEFKSWVDNKALQENKCKKWVPSKTTDDISRDGDLINRVRIPGFGINGVDMVTFTYDMDEARAEEEAHKKYLFRREYYEQDLWEPKYKKKIVKSAPVETRMKKSSLLKQGL